MSFSSKIKAYAIEELGFADVGITAARKLTEKEAYYKALLDQEAFGEMTYMERNVSKRLDPRELIPGAKSIICLAYNYYPETELSGDLKISKYAFGDDYHYIMKPKIKSLMQYIQQTFPKTTGRAFVDSAPVMERDWAAQAGLGWMGKNTLLINPKKGSFFFLGELIIDLELDYDKPIHDHCGTCTRCIDACPTDALSPEGYKIEPTKCISYLTIEQKGEIPQAFLGKLENNIYGCDICQDVCPWNRFSVSHEEPLLSPSNELIDMKKEDWEQIDEVTFRSLFKKSAVKRTRLSGLKRNINFVNNQ